jgi:hypothetical protein
MGFFKRRKDVDGAALLRTPSIQAEMERLARISFAASEDDLTDERERQMWRNVEHGAVVLSAAADALVPEMEHLSPEDARAAVLAAFPDKHSLANLVEFEVWKGQMRQLDDPSFHRSAVEVEQSTTTRNFHGARILFLEEERLSRGLEPGSVSDPAAAAHLHMQRLSGESLLDERAALRLDILMNGLQDAIDART